jgi:tRNA(Arg) A34 adenosine deaminase TadA
MPSHEYYMSLAIAASKGSKCEKKQVGSVIVDKEGRVYFRFINNVYICDSQQFAHNES